MEELLRRAFIEYGVKLSIEKGKQLSRENETRGNQYVYWLEDGICALTSMTKGGEEWTYLYFRAKRLVAFSKLIVSRKEQPDKPALYLAAKTNCSVYRLTDRLFRKIYRTNPEFNALMLQTLADNYDELLIHFHRTKEETAAARLCRLLLDTSALKGNKKTLPRFFTYDELARYLGTHTVTVSRIMAELLRRGFISKAGREIVIEREDELWSVIQAESYLRY